MRLITGEFVENHEFYYGEHLKIQKFEDGIDRAYMNVFELSDNLPRIPIFLWRKMITLFSDYSDQNMEAHVRFFFKEDDKSWLCVVPMQTATMGNVVFDYSLGIDIVTGVEYNFQELYKTYDCIWQIHSHHSMGIKYPSKTDDEDEIKNIGGYAIVSNMSKNTYTVGFTVVSNDGIKNKRYFVDDSDNFKVCNELDGTTDTFVIYENSYHPNVINYIKKPIPKVYPLYEKEYFPIPYNNKTRYEKEIEKDIQKLINTYGINTVMDEIIKQFPIGE